VFKFQCNFWDKFTKSALKEFLAKISETVKVTKNLKESKNVPNELLHPPMCQFLLPIYRVGTKSAQFF